MTFKYNTNWIRLKLSQLWLCLFLFRSFVRFVVVGCCLFCVQPPLIRTFELFVVLLSLLFGERITIFLRLAFFLYFSKEMNFVSFKKMFTIYLSSFLYFYLSVCVWPRFCCCCISHSHFACSCFASNKTISS